MPKKLEFERDLVRVNIRRLDHDGIMHIRRQANEPFYSLIQRIWYTYNTDKGVLENENAILKDSVQTLLKRALLAEAKLERQSRLG